MKQMKWRNSKMAFSGLMALILAGSMASSSLHAGDVSAPILQAAGVARHDYSSRLKEFPAKTEFDRFVENIDNYDVGLSDAGDNFIVVFKLRKKKGEVVMGGGAIYTVRKKDLVIVNFSGQE